MYKRKRAGNTITRKINSTKDTAAKADKNHYISNSYLEGFIPIDTEYFTASFISSKMPHYFVRLLFCLMLFLMNNTDFQTHITLYALICIYKRVFKPFFIFFHADGTSRTDCIAGGTAAAVFLLFIQY